MDELTQTDRSIPDDCERFLEIQRGIIELMPKAPGEPVRKAWENSIQALDRMAALLEWRRKAFGVCIIPAEIQVDRTLFQRVTKALYIEPSAIDLDLPQELIRSWADAKGVPVLDPSREFEKRISSGERLYIERNTHLNEAGCKVLSDLLAKFVARMLRPEPGGGGE